MKKESRGSLDAGTIGETCSDFFDSKEWKGTPRPSVVVRDAISDGRRLDEPRLRDAVGQLARAVFVLHRRGLLHLDIKPSNVLVGPGGRVVLLDFGLVRPSVASASESRMTLGTPAYMAPEQAAGERVGTPADWYAVGVVLYRALTGQLPFVGNAADVMVTKQLYAPSDPATLDRDLPKDLCALTCELLRVDPGERPSGEEVLRRLGVPIPRLPRDGWEKVFIGRVQEEQMLEDALELANAGSKVVCTVSGGASLGKTTLLERVLRGRGDELLLMDGATFEREAVPYVSFDRCIDRLVSGLGEQETAALNAALPVQLELVSQMFPTVGGIVATAGGEGGGVPRASRQKAAQALCEVFEWLSRRPRVPVLWIDGAEWSDRESALLMRALITEPTLQRCLIVLSFQREDGTESPMLKDIERLERLELPVVWRHVEVGPLPEEATVALATRLLADRATPEVVEAISLESEGNPLFVEAMCRFDQTGGLDNRRESRLSLHHVVARTLDRLPERQRRLVETLAVVGRPMEVHDLVTASGLKDVDPVEDVEGLVAAQLVATQRGPSEILLSIVHERVGTLIRGWIPHELAPRLHRGVAEVLTRSGRTTPERLARHYAAGQDLARAATYAIMAAERATESLAFESAASLYELALGWSNDASSQRQLALRVALARAHESAGNLTRAAEEYVHAANSVEGARRRDFFRLAGRLQLSAGRILTGVELFRRSAEGASVELASHVDEKETRGPDLDHLLDRLAALLKAKERPSAAGITAPVSPELDHFLALMEGTGAGLPRTCAWAATRALDLSIEAEDLRTVTRCLAYLCVGGTLSAGGSSSTARALALLRACEPHVERDTWEYILRWNDLAEAVSRVDSHGVIEQAAAIRRLAEQRSTGVSIEVSTTLGIEMEATLWAGQLGPLLRTAGALERDTPVGEVPARHLLAQTYLSIEELAANRPVLARQRLRSAQDLLEGERWTPTRFAIFRALIWCDLYEGQVDAAHWRLEGAWPLLRRSSPLQFRPWAVQAALLRDLLAAEAAAQGVASRRRAVSNAKKTLARLDAGPTAFERGACALLRGTLGRLQGDDRAWRSGAEHAAGCFSEGGMHVWAAAASRASQGPRAIREIPNPQTLFGHEARHPVQLVQALTGIIFR